MWAENINIGVPFCSGQQNVSLDDLGVDNIVGEWMRRGSVRSPWS